MVLWALISVVSFKYVWFVMRADNDGEGGILALAALIRRIAGTKRTGLKAGLVLLGVRPPSSRRCRRRSQSGSRSLTPA